MKVKLLLFAAVLLFNSNQLFSHAIWIEANLNGTIGETQEAKVFLGEYAANERDLISNWFSNMKDFTLWLTAPNGTKSQLTVANSGNYFKATFTPTVAGVYVLSIDQTVDEIYGGTKIHYYALANVVVNNSLVGSENINTVFDFAMQTDFTNTHTLNAPVTVKLTNKKAALTNADLTVQAAEGWSKKFKADKKGKVTFESAWAGNYMLEGSYSQDEKGTHLGKEFQSVWYCITNCINVVK
jgi:uncharacterized GH25 family protein